MSLTGKRRGSFNHLRRCSETRPSVVLVKRDRFAPDVLMNHVASLSAGLTLMTQRSRRRWQQAVWEAVWMPHINTRQGPVCVCVCSCTYVLNAEFKFEKSDLNILDDPICVILCVFSLKHIGVCASCEKYFLIQNRPSKIAQMSFEVLPSSGYLWHEDWKISGISSNWIFYLLVSLIRPFSDCSVLVCEIRHCFLGLVWKASRLLDLCGWHWEVGC